MKFMNFLDVSRTAQQSYFKDGVELIYPDQKRPIRIAILPSYDPDSDDPTSWVPAVVGGCESDFYTTVRAAKFVGHGNRRAKTSFLSPRTFDLDADDPYDAFYEYCSRSDKWSYLTKDRRGKRLTGEVEGAVIPRMKNFFVANVMDVSAGSRGGVFITELSETVAKSILYSLRKDGTRIDGIAFQRDESGRLVYGDITDPNSALVFEVACGRTGYIARPLLDRRGNVVRTEIPATLLQHRRHMDMPGTFINVPESGQEIVDRLAGMLRGYRSEDGDNEIEALKEAMSFAYRDKYTVDESADEGPSDPFAGAAERTAESRPSEQSRSVSDAIERGVAHERYTPVRSKDEVQEERHPSSREGGGEDHVVKAVDEPSPAPGEQVDPSDIAAVRAMLMGGK